MFSDSVRVMIGSKGYVFPRAVKNSRPSMSGRSGNFLKEEEMVIGNGLEEEGEMKSIDAKPNSDQQGYHNMTDLN